MPVTLIMELGFALTSGLHTAGDRAELWVDKALAVDWQSAAEPTVPATSIKGWLRENAERILRGWGQQVCDASQPFTTCGCCLVCRYFGAPRRRSPLRFADGRLDASRDVRTSVSLSRYRKTAYEGRLFATEVAWSKLLATKVRGTLMNMDEAREAAALLWLAAKGGFALGSARSRGLGWLRLEHFSAACDSTPIDESELVRVANTWRGEPDA